MGNKLRFVLCAIVFSTNIQLIEAQAIQVPNLKYENFIEQNSEDNPSFLRNFYISSFCFDGYDGQLAAEKFYKLLRANPKRTLTTLNESLNWLNENQNAAETTCMNHIPDLNFRADAYSEFSMFIKDSFSLGPMKNKALAAAAQDEFLAWREDYRKNPKANPNMNKVLTVLDRLQSNIFQ